MTKGLIALIDLDSMLHIVAAVQYAAGNRDNKNTTKQHVHRFISTICKNTGSEKVILLYQKDGHTNFRNDILPEYKGHRVKSDAIKCWKPTIIEAFSEANAYGLQHLETDDAMSILAEHIGYKKVVLVTGDKDMAQVPTMQYNPFKPQPRNKPKLERWNTYSIFEANAFFWMQVLAGDPTDMPNDKCGIEGVGMGKARKMCDNQENFHTIIQKEYSKKYGNKEGFIRAQRTYKMVRLLKLSDLTDTYVNEATSQEMIDLLADVDRFTYKLGDVLSKYTDASNLFT